MQAAAPIPVSHPARHRRPGLHRGAGLHGSQPGLPPRRDGRAEPGSGHGAAGGPGGRGAPDDAGATADVPGESGAVLDAGPEPDSAARDAPVDAQTDSSLSAGLVARYRLDPVSGTSVPDDSGTQFGIAAGAVTWPDGFPTDQFSNGGALALDGSSGYIMLPASLIPEVSVEKSISLWFWLPAPIGDFRRTLLSFNNSTDLGVQVGLQRGFPSVWLWNSAADSSVVQASSAATGGWTHLVYTHRAGSHALHVNGTLADSGTNNYRTGAAITQVILGAFEPDRGEEERWPGRIDDLRIYDRVLTASEIAALGAGDP